MTIDEKYIKLLEEDRNAFIAFCYNIINGKYISVIDAAKEQLSYLENKVMEEARLKKCDDMTQRINFQQIGQ